jgi:hypothetical protein
MAYKGLRVNVSSFLQSQVISGTHFVFFSQTLNAIVMGYTHCGSTSTHGFVVFSSDLITWWNKSGDVKKQRQTSLFLPLIELQKDHIFVS